MQILNLFLEYGLLFIYFQISSAREEWIDPHDMHIRRTVLEESNCRCDKHSNHEVYQEKLTNVLLNKMIRAVYFDRHSEAYSGILNIHFNTKNYEFLTKFNSHNHRQEEMLIELISILNSSIERGFYSGTISVIGEFLYFLFYNETFVLCATLLCTALVLWKLKPQNYTTLFKLFFPLVYMSDFSLRYIALLEEAEVDKLLEMKHHNDCDSNKMGWFEYTKYMLGFIDCQQNERKYMLSQRAAIHIITPMKVISQQFDVIVPILKHLGEGFGSFMMALVDDVPWYVKPFVALLAFLLVVLLVLMIGSYLFGLSLKLNLFYMIQFMFTPQEHVQQNPQITLPQGDNLKSLIEAVGKKSETNVYLMNADTSKMTFNKTTSSTSKTKSGNKKLKKVFKPYIECSLSNSGNDIYWCNENNENASTNQKTCDQFFMPSDNCSSASSGKNISDGTTSSENILTTFHSGTDTKVGQSKEKVYNKILCELDHTPENNSHIDKSALIQSVESKNDTEVAQNKEKVHDELFCEQCPISESNLIIDRLALIQSID